ncbi:MAG: glycosyltransferase family 39 protein [Patescibacteria group bacterium]
MKHIRKPSKIFIILMAIFLIGLILRLVFISFGLPRLYLVDEEFFVEPALNIANGALNPGWFGAPAQSLIYGMGFIFRIINFFVNQAHETALAASQNYQLFTTIFQTAGRMLPALLGAATVLLAYFVGKHWNKRTGIIAAILVATSFFLVDHSHIIRPDIIQTFFLMLMLFFVFRLIDQPAKIGWYLGVGASLGVAAATKYPSLFFVVPLIMIFVWLWRQKKLFIKNWLASGFAAIVASFVTGPFLFLNFHRVLYHLVIENRTEHGGHDDLGFWGNLKWYTIDTLHWQLGTFLFLITLAIIFFICYKIIKKKYSQREFKFFFLLISVISYILLLSVLNLHWARWLIPAVTILFIMGAAGLDYIFKYCSRRRWLAVLICIIIFAAPAWRLARTMYGWADDYTIEKARQYILREMPEGTEFVVEPYTPDLPADKYITEKVPNLTVRDREEYEKQGATHFIISGGVHGRILQEAGFPDPEPNFVWAAEQYQQLTSQNELIYAVEPNPEYTPEQLLYSNDFSVLRTCRVDLLKGDYVRIYKYSPK